MFSSSVKTTTFFPFTNLKKTCRMILTVGMIIPVVNPIVKPVSIQLSFRTISMISRFLNNSPWDHLFCCRKRLNFAPKTASSSTTQKVEVLLKGEKRLNFPKMPLSAQAKSRSDSKSAVTSQKEHIFETKKTQFVPKQTI